MLRRMLFAFMFTGLFVLATAAGVTQTTQGDWFSDNDSAGVQAGRGCIVADEWLAGFEYRRPHVINGSEGAGTGYQVKIVVHYGPGTDSGEHVYLNSLCQPDFDDIRFADDDGITPLAYWREDYTTSSNATFWVKVMDSLESSATIYIYFGNPICDTTSNGAQTFIFFDDFESGALDPSRWYDVGDWNIVTTNVKHGTYAAHCVGETPDLFLRANVTSLELNYGFMYHTWARFNGTYASAGYPVLMREQTGTQFANNIYSVMVYYGNYSHYTTGTGAVEWPNNSAVNTSMYYRTEVGLDIDRRTQYGWRSGSYMGSVPLRNAVGGNITQVTYLTPGAGLYAGQDIWLDDFLLRKWVAEEPQHDDWGEVEYSTAPPLLDGPDDMTFVTGTTGNVVRWNASDLYPDLYRLYIDGVLSVTQDWDGSDIEFLADSLPIGTHNLTLVVIDTHGNEAMDTVNVVVQESIMPLMLMTAVAVGAVALVAIVIVFLRRTRMKGTSA